MLHIVAASGITQAREATGPFFFFFNSDTAWVQCFRTLCALLHSRSTLRTWCLLCCCHGKAYLGTPISVLAQQIVRLGFLNFTSHIRHFQMDPDVKFRKPNKLLLCSSRRLETCGTEENGHQRSFAVRGLAAYVGLRSKATCTGGGGRASFHRYRV